MTVVAYLNEVVNFYVILNDCAAKCCPLYGTVAAYEYIVANDYVAKMGKVYGIAIRVALEPEPFLSENCARLNLAIVAKHNMVV